MTMSKALMRGRASPHRSKASLRNQARSSMTNALRSWSLMLLLRRQIDRTVILTKVRRIEMKRNLMDLLKSILQSTKRFTTQFEAQMQTVFEEYESTKLARIATMVMADLPLKLDPPRVE
jgi:hypothetical protein